MTGKIRIRHVSGTSTIENLPAAKLIAEKIESITGISIARQVWKCGYPPKTSTFSAEDPLPFEVDSIIVSEGSESSLRFSKVEPPTADGTDTISLPFEIGSNDDEPAIVDPEGYVVRRVVDADNSCLFHSIGYAYRQPTTSSPSLRSAVASAILKDPTTHSEAFLGKPTAEYATWIQDASSWGGQIELSVLSKLLKLEIVALDIIRNRHDAYGTEDNYRRRIFVIYDGIHYDAVAYCFDPQLPPEMDITVFSPNDLIVMERAKALCEQEHKRKAFTDTSSFSLRCLVCQQGLKGQAEAAQHARQTGHSNFSEY